MRKGEERRPRKRRAEVRKAGEARNSRVNRRSAGGEGKGKDAWFKDVRDTEGGGERW